MKYLLIILLQILIFSCQQSDEYNSIIIISNGMQDSSATRLQIDINDNIVFDGFIKESTHADHYNIHKSYLKRGPNQITVSLPKHKISEELTFDFDSVAAIDVILHYEPLSNTDNLSMEVIKALNIHPSIQLKMIDTKDINQYKSLEHTLLNGQ